jgi:hypothetical protein
VPTLSDDGPHPVGVEINYDIDTPKSVKLVILQP